MRTIAISSLLLFVGAAAAQSIAQLGNAIGLDVRVNWVNWHDQGGALMYTREISPSGLGLGLFRDGDKDGNVVLQIGESDHWRAQWFPNEKKGLAFLGRGGQGVAKDQMEWSIYWLDPATRTATKIYSKLHAPNAGVSYEPEVSPSLSHVVIEVRENDKLSHLVIPAGSSSVVPAIDIDLAVANGASGPFWSIDGTACYHPTGTADSDSAAKVADGGVLSLSGEFFITAKTQNLVLDKLPIVSFMFRKMIVPAATGAPVLELMPMNVRLRPVRFRGPFEHPEAPAPIFFTRSTSSAVTFGHLQGHNDSLWLTDSPEGIPEKGVLVAPKSELSWLAPGSGAIAYLVDGALFVRTVSKSR